MKTLFFFLLSVTFSFNTQAGASAQPKANAKKTPTQFGGKITSKNSVSLEKLIENYSKHKGQVVTFEATPKKVCQKSGCWMVLESGGQQVRTLFKDYGFFVPKDLAGKKVRVQGVMGKKKVSAATRRHYMKDAGADASEIKKVVSSEEQLQFTADAVELI